MKEPIKKPIQLTDNACIFIHTKVKTGCLSLFLFVAVLVFWHHFRGPNKKSKICNNFSLGNYFID